MVCYIVLCYIILGYIIIGSSRKGDFARHSIVEGAGAPDAAPAMGAPAIGAPSAEQLDPISTSMSTLSATITTSPWLKHGSKNPGFVAPSASKRPAAPPEAPWEVRPSGPPLAWPMDTSEKTKQAAAGFKAVIGDAAGKEAAAGFKADLGDAAGKEAAAGFEAVIGDAAGKEAAAGFKADLGDAAGKESAAGFEADSHDDEHDGPDDERDSDRRRAWPTQELRGLPPQSRRRARQSRQQERQSRRPARQSRLLHQRAPHFRCNDEANTTTRQASTLSARAGHLGTTYVPSFVTIGTPPTTCAGRRPQPSSAKSGTTISR